MTRIIYNITSTHVNPEIPGDNIQVYKPKKKPCEDEKIPGWMHIDPINTQIDLESVAYQLSDYKFTPGFTVTVDDLLHPKPLDYEATPKFK